MSEVLILIAVTCGAFIATNLDNLLLLVALYSRFERQPWVVTAGYFTGMILIGIITLVIGEVGGFIPLAYLGLLGVIPLTMGLFSAWKLLANTKSGKTASIAANGTGLTVFLTLTTTQLSNSADTILTFSALLAESSDPSDYLIAPTFLVMTGVFSGVAWFLLKQPKLRHLLNRYGQYVTPLILILVGLYILSNTASDLMPG